MFVIIAESVDDTRVLSKEMYEEVGRERSRSEGVRSMPIELSDFDRQKETNKKDTEEKEKVGKEDHDNLMADAKSKEKREKEEKRPIEDEEKKREEEERRKEEERKRVEEEQKRMKEEREREVARQQEHEKEKQRIEESMRQEEQRRRARLEQEQREHEEDEKTKEKTKAQDEESEEEEQGEENVVVIADENGAEKLAGSTVHIFDDYGIKLSKSSSPREDEINAMSTHAEALQIEAPSIEPSICSEALRHACQQL